MSELNWGDDSADVGSVEQYASLTVDMEMRIVALERQLEAAHIASDTWLGAYLYVCAPAQAIVNNALPNGSGKWIDLEYFNDLVKGLKRDRFRIDDALYGYTEAKGLLAENKTLRAALRKAGTLSEYDGWPDRHPRVYGAMAEALGD